MIGSEPKVLSKGISYIDLFFFSVKIGIRAILRGVITKESIKRVLCPLDVSRYYELPKVASSLKIKKGFKILDISSPKLISYFLANKYPEAEIFAIDNFRQEIISWKKVIDSPRNLKVLVEDATKLSFPNNYFDEVFSVSVIEHLGNERDYSDGQMVKEVYRVLKKGGRFIFTTIISKEGKILFAKKKLYSSRKTLSKKVFFCRVYTPSLVEKRILRVMQFNKIEEEIYNYKFSTYEYIFNKLVPFSTVLGWLNLILAPQMLFPTKNKDLVGERAEYFAVLEKR